MFLLHHEDMYSNSQDYFQGFFVEQHNDQGVWTITI